jgi:hypothetical protein
MIHGDLLATGRSKSERSRLVLLAVAFGSGDGGSLQSNARSLLLDGEYRARDLTSVKVAKALATD